MFTIQLDCLAGLQNIMEKLQPDGKAQYMFSSKLMDIADDYVPKNTGVLKNSAYVEKNGTAIVYDMPYARIMWYGKVMVDPITNKAAFFKEGYGFWSRPKKYGIYKVESDRTFNYKEAPRRGPYWVERAYIDNEQTLQQELIDYITRFDI